MVLVGPAAALRPAVARRRVAALRLAAAPRLAAALRRVAARRRVAVLRQAVAPRQVVEWARCSSLPRCCRTAAARALNCRWAARQARRRWATATITTIPHVDGGTEYFVEHFKTGSTFRDFRVTVPRQWAPGQAPIPLVMGFHWLNADADSITNRGEFAATTEQLRFIAVAPRAKYNGTMKAYQFNWPFVETSYDANGAPLQEEATFTNDMISCLSEQFNVDQKRIGAMGVSAGALWISTLMSQPVGDRFASFLVMSGGLGTTFGLWQMTFTPAAAQVPRHRVVGRHERQPHRRRLQRRVNCAQERAYQRQPLRHLVHAHVGARRASSDGARVGQQQVLRAVQVHGRPLVRPAGAHLALADDRACRLTCRRGAASPRRKKIDPPQ